MGKYTSLARKVEERKPQSEGGPPNTNILNININNIYSNRERVIDKPLSDRPKDTVKGSKRVETLQDDTSGSKDGTGNTKTSDTNLRTTNLTNLIRSGDSETTLRPTTLTTLIESTDSVLDLAREKFGLSQPFDPEEHPLPPPIPGRDPLVKTGTNKAIFFKGDWRNAWPPGFTVYGGGKA